MAAELGVAYVSIVPEAKGLGRKIAKEFGAVDKAAESTGRSSGSKLMVALGAAAKKAAMGALVGAGVAAGAALMGGFASAVNQQTAQKVLSGLYGSASQATQMMEDLRKVSSTSPIEYTAYTKAAEALAYAGVEGGQAVSVLENVGHAITATGGTSEHMDRATSAVTKMVNAGKVSLDSLQELSGSGVPIISGLADHFGVSMEDINKMASEGAIGLEDVVSVMENATGDNFQMSLQGSASAAQSFGNQFKIAKDNIVTAIGSSLVPMLEKIAPSIAPVSDAIVNGIEKLPEIFDRVKNAAQTAFGVIQAWAPMIAAVTLAIVAYNVAGWATYLWQSRAVIIGAAKLAMDARQAAMTGALALAQRGLNAAMRANPIGFIITAIILLVGAFVMAYQNVDWFRNLVDTAWAAIKVAISAVVTWFTTVAWPAIQTAITFLGNMFSWLYTNIILPVWNGIKTAIAAAWAFISPIFNFIVNFIKNFLIIYFQLLWTVVQLVWKSIQIAIKVAWEIIKVIFNAIVSFVRDVLGPIFTWLYNNVIKPVWNFIKNYISNAWAGIKIIFNAIKSFLQNTLGPVFEWLYNNVIKPVWNNIKSSINTVWKFVRDKIFDPMKKAVSETVPNAFEAGKDAIAEAWNKIKEVAKKPVKFVIDTVINKGIIDNFNKIAGIFDVDKIDHVKLPKGFARGGYTGPGGKYKPAGIVHADEFVVQKSARRRFERENPGALDHLNRTGSLPALGGYASGGKVGGTLWDAAQWWIQRGARASRHSWFNGGRRITSGHSNGSMHYSDQAVDFNMQGTSGTSAKEQAFFDRHIGTFQSLFPGIRTIWRAKDHYDHLHIDTKNGANMGSGDGSGGGGLLDILNPFEGLFDKIKEGISSNGMFGDLIAGGAKKMVQAPIDWIKSKADWLVDIGENAVDAVGVGTTKARVKAVAMGRGWGFGQQWRDLSALIQQESSWNKNAANPTTSARGLFQKMTSIHGPLESTVEGQAGWGLNYIADRYGSPSAAWAFHKRNNWYAGGGHVTPTLYDKGGMLQPGTSLVANKTRKPEYILPARVTDALMDGRTGGNGITIDRLVIEAGSEADGRSLARDFLGEIRRQQRGGVYVGA